MNDSSRHVFLLVFISIGLLVLLSLVPWSGLTGNLLKDFDLFGDLRHAPIANVDAPEIPAQPEDAGGGDNTPVSVDADSVASDSMQHVHVVPDAAPTRDGIVLVENYTNNSEAFGRFRAALAGGDARVAVLGDSYIEGDIFCQDLRDKLQQRYGGSGVGFMAMHSDFPGFRHTVRQSDKGWTMHDIRTFGKGEKIRTLSSDYARSCGSASTTFKGSGAFPGTQKWNNTRFLFIAPDSGTVSITLSDGAARNFAVQPSEAVQMLEVSAETDIAEVATDIPGLVALGTYLDGASGVALDCMSVRGNSGMGHRFLNNDLCGQMARYVNYDLIILEFGMNAISPDQTNYSAYAIQMKKSIDRIRQSYPDADILVMGVGDRGAKKGAAVESLEAAAAMLQAQRRLAVNAGTLFWDTRAAMGGDGAIAEWRKRKLVNADYIHLNHAGGAELASLLDKALQIAINE